MNLIPGLPAAFLPPKFEIWGIRREGGPLVPRRTLLWTAPVGPGRRCELLPRRPDAPDVAVDCSRFGGSARWAVEGVAAAGAGASHRNVLWRDDMVRVPRCTQSA
jgi:hypothetical protein